MMSFIDPVRNYYPWPNTFRGMLATYVHSTLDPEKKMFSVKVRPAVIDNIITMGFVGNIAIEPIAQIYSVNTPVDMQGVDPPNVSCVRLDVLSDRKGYAPDHIKHYREVLERYENKIFTAEQLRQRNPLA